MSIAITNDIPYGELAAQRLDLYIPATSSSERDRPPMICFVHGGAWRSEDKSDHRELAVRLAHRTGCAVAVPNYRLTPNKPTPETALHHPAHAEDVLAALEFLVRPTSPDSESRQSGRQDSDSQHPPDNARADEIYAIGHSCGTHILTAILLDSSKSTPSLSPSPMLLNAVRGVALSEGIYDIDLLLQSFPTYKAWFISNTFGDKLSYSSDSTISYPRRENGGDPTWLIVHSSGDTLIDVVQSQAIYEHLESLKFKVTKDWKTLIMEHNDMLRTSQYSDLTGDFINELISSQS